VPFWTISASAALPEAFSSIGLNWAKYVVSIGALCGMTTTLFGSLFSLPRCMYAMASDGLLFSFLRSVNQKTQVSYHHLWLPLVMHVGYSFDHGGMRETWVENCTPVCCIQSFEVHFLHRAIFLTYTTLKNVSYKNYRS
jgi:amino acid transporter